MDDFRPLRDAFDRLVARGPGSSSDPDAAEASDPTGPAGLEPALLAEAIVGYADTADIEVAEHLEGFVTAVTGLQDPDPGLGLELLGTAALTSSAGVDDAFFAAAPGEPGPRDDPGEGPAHSDLPDDDIHDLGFGTGTREVEMPDAASYDAEADAGTLADTRDDGDPDAGAPAWDLDSGTVVSGAAPDPEEVEDASGVEAPGE